MTLKAAEFIRRFLLHVLPAGFVRIRHYGFLANRVCREKLALCRALLGAERLPSPSRPSPPPSRRRPSKDGPRRTPAPPAARAGWSSSRPCGRPRSTGRSGWRGSRRPSGRASIRPEPSARGGTTWMNRRRRDRPSEGDRGFPVRRAGSCVPDPGDRPPREARSERRGRHPRSAPRSAGCRDFLAAGPSPRGRPSIESP